MKSRRGINLGHAITLAICLIAAALLEPSLADGIGGDPPIASPTPSNVGDTLSSAPAIAPSSESSTISLLDVAILWSLYGIAAL